VGTFVLEVRQKVLVRARVIRIYPTIIPPIFPICPGKSRIRFGFGMAFLSGHGLHFGLETDFLSGHKLRSEPKTGFLRDNRLRLEPSS